MSKRKISKKWIVLLSIIGLMVVIRLMLPYIVLRYANKVLGEMEGYKGHIDDVDLHIYRGAYQIDNLVIKKVNANIPKPFIDIKKIDLSIEWAALLKGKVVGEITLNRADLNFVGGSSEKNSQTGTETDWTKPIKKLMPLKVNKFVINDGKVSYYDFTSSPQVNVYVDKLQLLATNLTNASDSSTKLPSKLEVKGTSIGKGNLNINAKINIIKQLPDFDANIKFTSVALKSLNDFTKAYGKFDFEKGSMSLFSEIAMADGKIDGYFKPLLTDVKILDLQEKDESLFNKVWQGLLEVTEEVLQNQRKDQFATKAPIKGTIKNIEPKVIPTILNILKNAFIKAFSQGVDEEINFEDATKEDKSDKKEERKKKREERKEERKKKREEKK